MATNVGTLVVTLEADLKKLKKGLNEAGKEAKTFTEKVGAWFGESKMAILGGAAAIGAAAIKSIQEYAQMEQSVVKLSQAMANQGIYSKQASTDLIDYAQSLQKVTTFQDDQIVSVEAQLTAFGLQGRQLKDVTKSTLDLAAAKGIDLSSAANLLGKAFIGETEAMSRYGIVIGKNIPDSEKFAAVMGKVNEMFGGQAEAMRQTTAGAWAGFQLAVQDVQKEVGAFLSGSAAGMLNWLAEFLNKTADGIKMIRGFASEVGGLGNLIKQYFILAIAAVLQTLTELVTKIPGVNFLFQTMGINIQETNAQLEEMALKLQQDYEQSSIGAAVVAQNEAAKRIEYTTTNKEFVNNKKMETEAEVASVLTREQAWIGSNLVRMQSEEDLRKRLELETRHWSEFSIKMVNQVTDQFGQGMADMIMEGKKFSDVVKGIWKSLASAIIAEIARMIAKWLAFQAMKAAATGGFGGFFAQGGMITEPSVITGLRSGVSYIAGEAGPEAVVPVDKLRKGVENKGMGDSSAPTEPAGRSLNVTVNISGQFVEGNESIWQRLIRDKIVPEIHRFTMSNPTGMFNRRRGATA